MTIEVPSHFHTRNDPAVIAAGIERGGKELLDALARRLGKIDLSGVDILDVGCGFRLAQAIVNLSIPIGSYTGIEVDASLVAWLSANVATHDRRFHFVHWNVRHALYNRSLSAPTIAEFQALPVAGLFDAITGYSLFTHLDPDSARQMLRLMQKSLRKDGALFFSMMLNDDSAKDYAEGIPNEPLAQAKYSPRYAKELISSAGLNIVSHEPPIPFMLDSFLCRPSVIES